MEAASLPIARGRVQARLAAAESFLSAAAVAAGALVYGAFVATSAFRVDGRLAFSLFDDGMISMTYARNLAEGHGLVWNAGEAPVEGYTNLLWTVWMAGLHLLPVSELHVSLLVMVTSAALLVATALAVRALAARLAPGVWWAPPLAAAATALYYPLAYWSLRGMEVGLLALLVAGAVLLTLRLEERGGRRDAVALGGVLVLGLLTRTDFVLVAGVAVAYLLLSRRKTALALGATVAALLVAHTALRLAYYGEPLPNTYYLKMEGVSLSTRLDRGLLALHVTAIVHLYAPIVVALAGLALAAARRSLARPVLLVAAAVVVQLAYSVYVGGDAWEWFQYSSRYVSTVAPLLFLLAVLGLRELMRAPRAAVWPLAATFPLLAMFVDKRPPRVVDLAPGVVLPHKPLLAMLCCGLAALLLAHPRARGVGVAALAFFVVTTPNFDPMRDWVRDGAYHVREDAEMSEYGLAIRANTHDDARIAVGWAGAIPYFADRRSVDLLGKSDRTIAHGPHKMEFYPGHSKWDLDHSYRVLHPDLVAQVLDLDAMKAADYHTLFNRPLLRTVVGVRSDTQLVDRDGLRTFLVERASSAAP